MDPVMELEHALIAEILAVAVEQVRPSVGPALVELRGAQQSIYEPGALDFGWRFIGEEGASLLGSGRRADQVERDAAQEGRVVAEAGGQRLDLLQLLIHQAVDVVVFRDLRPAIAPAIA